MRTRLGCELKREVTVQTIYVMLIEKNRPVERFDVIIAYDAQLHTAAKTCLFLSRLESKVMMNFDFDFTGILCADPLLTYR